MPVCPLLLPTCSEPQTHQLNQLCFPDWAPQSHSLPMVPLVLLVVSLTLFLKGVFLEYCGGPQEQDAALNHHLNPDAKEVGAWGSHLQILH